MAPVLTILLCVSGVFAASPVITDPAKTELDPQRLARIPVRMKAFADKGISAQSIQ
jgi:hypothetical protein